MRLELRELTRKFGATAAVERLSIALDAGRIGCLLGPSGSGKTTVLRCIAGFERPDAGEVLAGGERLAAPGFWVPPERRRIGMVFQDYALFPHLAVLANVGFGLRDSARAQRQRRALEMLELVGLADQADKFPHELSGGQQQRVALARALAPRPRLVLLDEPFSNLDAEVRMELAQQVRTALTAEGATALLVTHDQREAFAIADQIGVLRAGRLEQWDVPWKLYHSPVTRFVADFVGEGSFIQGTVLGPGRVSTELGVIEGQLTRGQPAGTHVDLLLRPDDVIHDDESDLRAEVVERVFRGAQFRYTLRLPSGATALSFAPSHHDHALGERIGIRLDAQHLVGFPRE
ncbi:MAG: ABC transporter ATP-binding protein [Steroidobacteraceae bacterium]